MSGVRRTCIYSTSSPSTVDTAAQGAGRARRGRIACAVCMCRRAPCVSEPPRAGRGGVWRRVSTALSLRARASKVPLSVASALMLCARAVRVLFGAVAMLDAQHVYSATRACHTRPKSSPILHPDDDYNYNARHQLSV